MAFFVTNLDTYGGSRMPTEPALLQFGAPVPGSPRARGEDLLRTGRVTPLIGEQSSRTPPRLTSAVPRASHRPVSDDCACPRAVISNS